MRRLQLSGAIVPHAPLLVPAIAGEKVGRATEATRTAFSALDVSAADVVVIVSPHGERDGVYQRVAGDLDRFGRRGTSVEHPTDHKLATALARRWGVEVVDQPLDHGIVVPLVLMKVPEVPVIGCSVTASPDPLSAALKEELDVATFVVASANTSAALTARAPLTERPAGRELDDRVLNALRSDPGSIEQIPADLWRGGGSCGRVPLTLFGRLFSEAHVDVLSYEHPFGVGYLVAVA